MSPRAGQVIRGLAAVVGVLAVVVGLPTLIVVLGSNPLHVLDIDWPSREQAWDWFTTTDYGFYKLSALIFVLAQVIFWCGWAWFTVLITHEFVMQLRERRGVYWSAEAGAMRRGAVAGLVATVLLLSSPGTAPTPEAPDVVSTSQLANPPAPVGFVANIMPTTLVPAPHEKVADELPRYKVHLGDTLWGLAERYLGDGPRWRQLYTLNQAVIPNPDFLDVGVVLRMPPDAALPPPPADPGPGARRLTVAPGDTLTGIAKRELGDPVAATRLWEINQGRTQPDGRAMTDADRLMPGWRLWIPAGTPSNGAAPPPPVRTAPPPSVSTAPPATPVPPPPPPSSSAPAPPASPATPDSTDARPVESPNTGVELPAGTWVTLALATGVVTSIVMMRRRRRHRQTPTPSLDPVPPVPPLPPVARVLWAAAHTTTEESTDTPDTAAATETQQVVAPLTVRPMWAVAQHPADDDVEDDAAAEESTKARPRRCWPPPAPVVTGRSVTGQRCVELTAAAGLGLDGDGSSAAARAVLVELLGQDSAHPPVVHLTADAAHQLFPTHPQAVPSVPGVLVCHDTTEQAARAVERELRRRMRLLDDHSGPEPDGHADATEALNQLRAGDPGQPLPTILLLTTAPGPDLHPRITGLLGLGQRLGVVGLVLGCWPTGLSVDSEHQVSTACGAVSQMRGTTLAALPEADAAQLLAVVLAARGGPDTPHHPAAPAAAAAPAGAQPPPPPATEPGNHLAVYVRVFGVLRIQANGGEIRGLNRRGRQVLAYLATHPDPVRADILDEEIFADTEDPRALRHTTISRTRAKLAEAAGATAEIIQLVNDHYQLNPAVVDTDAWRLSRLMTAARDAGGDPERREHLRGILDVITGDPLQAAGYEWAEAVAERLRQQAVNALLLLAELTQADDAATALAALAMATTLNPHSEPLYYKAIRIYVDNGNHHSALQLYGQLERQLDEIEEEPELSAQDLIPPMGEKTYDSPGTPVRQPHRQPHRQTPRHPTVLKDGTSTVPQDGIKAQLRPDLGKA